MRIAAIDIGTNSIHMVIAQSTSQSGFEVVDREREVVQVGRGSFGAGRLRADAVRRTVDSLARFVQLARRHQVDRILCTATAAVREAKNGGEFLTLAREVAGLAPRVIPAEEEARLIYLAVKAALGLDERPALIVDIGGGSMQLVVGNRDKQMLTLSAPLGALRLTEELLESDPPTRGELGRLRRQMRKQAREALERVVELRPRRVYGSSGSIHALAQMAHWEEHGQPIPQINGHVLSLESLQRLTRRLGRMTVAERERLPGIDAKRAEIIVPGALVLEHVLETVGAEAVTISDFGVREGLVIDYIASHAEEIGALDQVTDLRLRSVLALLQKFKADGNHARHVTRLTLALFDQLKSVHGLGPHPRELLQFAALLHDIGAVIGYDGHAEHSYYIIKHGNLRGLSAHEIELVANAARYHSKARPRKRDKEYRGLDRISRRTVRWLAALLRVAEGLDRSHYQLIKAVRVLRRGSRISILVTARREARLEIWAARRRMDLLSRLSECTVRVALDPAAEHARKAQKNGPSQRDSAAKTEPGRQRSKPAASSPRLKVVGKR